MSTEIKADTAIRDQDEAISLSYWLATQMGEHVDSQDEETLTETVQRYVSREWMPKTGANPTPAPLDPSKGGPFGGGDSVRYVGPPHRSYTAVGIIPGRVFTVRDGTNVENGVISLYGSSGMFSAIKFELVSRADHQPAPEPEPEWKPGTVGTATLNHLVSDNSSFGMRVMRVEWDGLNGFATETGRIVEDGSTTYSISDFVPLVVIDPADVDVNALAAALGREWSGKNFDAAFTWGEIAGTVLAELGIEATR